MQRDTFETKLQCFETEIQNNHTSLARILEGCCTLSLEFREVYASTVDLIDEALSPPFSSIYKLLEANSLVVDHRREVEGVIAFLRVQCTPTLTNVYRLDVAKQGLKLHVLVDNADDVRSYLARRLLCDLKNFLCRVESVWSEEEVLSLLDMRKLKQSTLSAILPNHVAELLLKNM